MRSKVSKTRLHLLRRIQAHDQQAMGLLYDHLAPLVYPVLLRMLGNPGEAEDLLIETFQQVWDGAASYDPLHGSVEGWVMSLARRRALARLLVPAQGRPSPVAQYESLRAQSSCLRPSDSPAAGSRGLSGEPAQAVQAALASLPAEQRLALDLAYYQGWSPAVMAQHLEQTVETMRTRVRLGLQQLRKALQPYLGVHP